MNRIDQLFQEKKNNILSIYYPAGYPNLNQTVEHLHLLQSKGLDLVEIGIPFSDPLADGPVIQQAAKQALDNGMTLSLLFEQLQNVRQSITMPLLLMGYWNVVYRFGVEAFLQKCEEVGIDGVILPDLPLEEYQLNYESLFQKYGVHNILLVTPQTTDGRLQKIERAASGFLYLVSSSATTGGSLQQDQSREEYFRKVGQLNVPSLIGFGISNRERFQHACKFANGAIVGTAFIEAMKEGREIAYLESLRDSEVSMEN